MQAVREIVHSKGSTISISIPPGFIDMDIEVLAFPVERKETTTYDFSGLSGRLKWSGDAVKQQREMRDEW
jgi:hypothetical protein